MLLNDRNIAPAIKYISTFTLILYLMQGTLYPASSVLAKASLAIYLAIGIFCLVNLLLSSTRQSIVYTATAFFLANIAYYFFSDTTTISLFYSINPQSPIKNTTIVFLTLFISLYLARRNLIEKKGLLVIYAIIFASGIISFFSLSPFSTSSSEAVNNSGYIFANLLPFIFLIKRKDLSLLLLTICNAIVIMSLKRGAILITFLFSAYYTYILFKESKFSTIQKASILAMLATMIALASVLLYSGNTMIQERVEQTLGGYSSGRDIIYEKLWSNWDNTESCKNILFGYGMSHTILATGGRYAHNDWLELLTNMGFFGVGLYLIFFLSIASNAAEAKRSITDIRIVVSVVIILIGKSLFSMGYTDLGSVPLMIMLGYALGCKDKQLTEAGV